MAVTIYKAGKYRTLAGKKISKNSQWVTLPSNAKIKANGKWYKLGFKSSSSSDLPDIDVPDFDFPDLPELNGPSLTEETLLHLNVTEPTTGTVWYMTPNGNGNMDGTSWENAFASSNIHVLMLSVSNGDRVYMSEGDYGVPTRSITIPEGISIYGGFIENDYSWETRDAFNHQTVWRGNGEFALFDLTSENTAQTIDGITCENFKNEIGESGNCTFRNMVLVGGTFSISSGLTNSKTSNCELTIGGNVEKLYNVCSETKNCTISGKLKNSTINLENGNLIALETQNVYVSNCNSVNVQSLSDSEIVNCKDTVSNDRVLNVKCYGGNITSNGFENVWCDKNVTSGGSCIDCNVEGNLTCEGNCTNCQIKGNLTSGGGCIDCNVEGNLTCEKDCTNCVVKGNIESKKGSCINCKSNGIISKISRDCTCYKSYDSLNGERNKIINSRFFNQDSSRYKTDDSVSCNYYILNGKLFYKDGESEGIQVGTESGWTNISGYSNSSYRYAYGIRDGYLYALKETTAIQVGSENGWTNVSGYSDSSAYYAHGIRNGYLYALNGTNATQVGTESGWTHISGFSSYSGYYAYGIRNGYLYDLSGTGAAKMRSESDWTNISGYSSSYSYNCAYGIRNGYLYALNQTSSTQVGSENGWTHISGYSSVYSDSSYAYGIRNGYLYALNKTTATQVGSENGWTHISGYSLYSYVPSAPSTSNYSYAHGIRNGYLYALNKTTAIQVGTESGWTHISGYYGIRNGYLYALKGVSCQEIYSDFEKVIPYKTDNSVPCDYYILNGKLFYKDETPVGNEEGWDSVSGYSDSSDTYAYGTINGSLYALQNTTFIQLENGGGWTIVSGYSSTDTYAYGIRNGYLYALQKTTATQVGTESGWTHISGKYDYFSSSSSNYFYHYAYGIRNGYLYCLEETTATQVGTESGWTHISGYSSSSTSTYYYAYGIRNGYLYALKETTATQVGNESDWTHISGHSSNDTYAYGIREGYLYALKETTATKSGNESGWTHISGHSSNDTYAYGIREGYLYALCKTVPEQSQPIQTNYINQIGEKRGWEFIAGLGENGYGICGKRLFSLSADKCPIHLSHSTIFTFLIDCDIINCNTDSLYNLKTENCNIINCKLNLDSKNSLIVNCDSNSAHSTYSTIVNSNTDLNSGDYNVFWNNDGKISSPSTNAQSEYNESNLLTLEYDNSIARFTSTGYYPAIGVQDLGDCPDPITDQDGYNAYVSSFGNWIPQSNTFLKGKGIKDEGIPNDLNGNPRPDSPTLGAYEPLSN